MRAWKTHDARKLALTHEEEEKGLGFVSMSFFSPSLSCHPIRAPFVIFHCFVWLLYLPAHFLSVQGFREENNTVLRLNDLQQPAETSKASRFVLYQAACSEVYLEML